MIKSYLNNQEVSFGRHFNHEIAEVSYNNHILFTANHNYLNLDDFNYQIKRYGNQTLHRVFTQGENNFIDFRWITQTKKKEDESFLIKLAQVDLTVYKANTENSEQIYQKTFKPTLKKQSYGI